MTQDEQTLSADEQTEPDSSAAGKQAIASDKANVSTGRSALSTGKAQEAEDCAGAGASSACAADKQKVSQDRTVLTAARQRLAAARLAAKSALDQNRARVAADRVRLTGDQATLASLRATAMTAGTTYTCLPRTGQVIRRDQRVYSVSGQPVPLLYGPVPAYRAFFAGMPAGADVGELTRNLIALGYGGGLARGDSYSAATAAAVERWQQALGLPVTGQIPLGDVVFEPGPIRVTAVTPSPGASYGGTGGSGGTVLTATGITPVVTVDLDVTQEYLVKPGDAVPVVLPDGSTTVGGHVRSVGSVAACPGGGGTGTGGSGSAGQSPCSSAGSNGGAGSNAAPTVPVTITLDHVTPGAKFDQAPVNVNITTRRAVGVLAMPVSALLALAGGGYGVDVVTGRDATRLVGVSTGMYSGTLVQVSGPGIRAGTRVEVPSS